MTTYAIIITVLFLAAAAANYFQFRRRPRGDLAHLNARMVEMGNAIIRLKNQNKKLKNIREALENESKDNFNSDIGRAVGSDLSADN